jgi:hypothetical protein
MGRNEFIFVQTRYYYSDVGCEMGWGAAQKLAQPLQLIFRIPATIDPEEVGPPGVRVLMLTQCCHLNE